MKVKGTLYLVGITPCTSMYLNFVNKCTPDPL